MTFGNQAFDLGLTKKYKWAGDGAIAESTNLPGLGNKIEGFVGINRYMPVLEGAAQHARATRSSSTTRWRGSSRSTHRARCPTATSSPTSRP